MVNWDVFLQFSLVIRACAMVTPNMTCEQTCGSEGSITYVAGKGMACSHVDFKLLSCPQCSCITDVTWYSVLL